MHKFKTNKISKNDFLLLNEKDVMFITNPGRMGDEDGSTFIVRNDNEFTVYRINGWMYDTEDEIITIDETAKQFPKWYSAWKNEESYKEKYTYLYMGFGNGLCVDNSIYNEFEQYLNKLVDEYLESHKDEKNENLKYSAIFNLWEAAVINMVNNKKYILK